jgi:hypothetical protein
VGTDSESANPKHDKPLLLPPPLRLPDPIIPILRLIEMMAPAYI